MKDILEKIWKGEIDINNQELFFSILIKGLMLKLNEEIAIRNIAVPHLIVHTGSDALYLENKGQDNSIEPFEVSNENYTYNIIPRCIVTPGSIDIVPDQLTNPYSNGYVQYQTEDSIYNLLAEFRRMPVKLGVELKYFTDSYRDMLELVQQIVTKLAFIKTYNIVYMGQVIKCSYKIPESYQGEWMTEMDGMTQDSKDRKVSLSIEVESNYPIFNCRTIMDSSHYITGFEAGLHMHRKKGIEEDIQTRETIKWNNKI